MGIEGRRDADGGRLFLSGSGDARSLAAWGRSRAACSSSLLGRREKALRGRGGARGRRPEAREAGPAAELGVRRLGVGAERGVGGGG
nr:unnamed protein product [Digitaria exilis]